MFDQQVQVFLATVELEPAPVGNFNETIETFFGFQVSYKFPLATGMGFTQAKSHYGKRFGKLPDWVYVIHPAHRIRLCKLSIKAGHSIPEFVSKEVLESYLLKYRASAVRNDVTGTNSGGVPEVQELVRSQVSSDQVVEFEVTNTGTIVLANFQELKKRSEFYESVYVNGFNSVEDLRCAMAECKPLAFLVQEIYIEIQSKIRAGLACFNCEDCDQEVEAWLSSLTDSDFSKLLIPEIEAWFDDRPRWGWEEDYLPKDSNSQGAALIFFQSIDYHLLDAIGVEIVEGQHPGSTYFAAELKLDVERANKMARKLSLNVRFKKA